VEGCQQAVTSGGAVTEDQVSGLLTAEVIITIDHRFHHISVADFGPNYFATVSRKGDFKSHVAHDRRHKGCVTKPVFLQHVQATDGEDLVTVNNVAFVVNENKSVGITIKGDSKVSLVKHHFFAKLLRVQCAAMFVYVDAIWVNSEHENLRAKLCKNLWCHAVGGAIRAINDQSKAIQSQVLRELFFQKNSVLSDGVIDPFSRANVCTVNGVIFQVVTFKQCLKFILVVVRKFVAVPTKKDCAMQK
jgi:hypothetical protein